MQLSIVGLLCLVVLGAKTPNRTYTYLEQERDNIFFTPYTPEERVTVAKGLQSMFDIYVHRQKKIDDFGAEYKEFSGVDIDPVPRVAEMVRNAANMTDKDFHYAFHDIFMSLRDLHTNYEMPGPYACFGFVQAPSFTLVSVQNSWFSDMSKNFFKFSEWSKFGKPKTRVAVKSFSIREEVLALTPAVSEMTIGDLVVTIDGKTPEEYIQAYKWETGGANDDASFRQGVTFMTSRPGSMSKIPREDKVTYVMESFNNPGKTYTVTIPWIASRRDDCYPGAMLIYNEAKNKNSSIPITSKISTRLSQSIKSPKGKRKISIKEWKESLITMKNIPLEFYNENFRGMPGADKVKFSNTSDPLLKWGIYAPATKNMGILTLSSFTPVGSDSDKIIKTIRNLLLNELKDTNSLLIDIRNNGGGQITMADGIPQLFGTPFTPGPARALIAPTNEKLFNITNDEWTRAYEKSKAGDVYTSNVLFSTVAKVNSLGVVYAKPVGVFNNAECYSSCDLLSASLQDNGFATIFGEDTLTGAGGANVVEYTKFLSNTLSESSPETFPEFPYASDNRTTVAQDARVSWRQSVRVGKNAGKLIENDGIKADYPLIRPTQLDLVPQTDSNTQYDSIANTLAEIGKKTGKNGRYFLVYPLEAGTASLGLPLTFDLDIANVAKVQVYSNGTALGSPLVIRDKARQRRQLQLNPQVTKAGAKVFEIRAFDSNDKPLFSTFRSFTFVPKSSDYLQLGANQTLSVNLTTGNYRAQYDSPGTGDAGFFNNGTTLQVGSNGTYNNDMDTQVSFYVTNSQKSMVAVVKATYDIEEGCDQFYIGYKNATGTYQFLKGKNVNVDPPEDIAATSGTGVIDRNFTIPATGDIEFFFRFTSDASISQPGIVISNLTFITV